MLFDFKEISTDIEKNKDSLVYDRYTSSFIKPL